MLNKLLQCIMFFFFLLTVTNPRLLGVIEVNRHGARYPNEFPDNYKHLEFGFKMSGALTANGLRQSEQLGDYLRNRYMNNKDPDYNILNEPMIINQVEVTASPKDRTTLTAAGIAKGLIPNAVPHFISVEQDKQFVEMNVPIRAAQTFLQPNIDIYVLSNQDNHLASPDFTCYIGKTLITELFSKKSTIKTFDIEIQDKAFAEIKSKLNLTAQEIANYETGIIERNTFLFKLYDFLDATYHYKENLIPMLSDDTWRVLQQAKLHSHYSLILFNSYLKKYITSKTLDNISIFFDELINGTTEKRLKIFSGHDCHLMALVTFLLDNEYIRESVTNFTEEVFFEIGIPLATSIIFELHQIGQNEYVRIYMNGELIRANFDEELEFDETVDGIPYIQFKDYIYSSIDRDYAKKYRCLETDKSK